MPTKISSILVAPNAFKHSLDALAAARAIGEGLELGGYRGELSYCPIGDGGDGTVALLLRQLGAEQVPKTVTGPLAEPVRASYGLVRQKKIALIEMSDASGIKLLKDEDRDPMKATSYGTGELILEALDQGVEEIIIGMGGSATVDGGCGILAALGARFYDKQGNLLDACPASLQLLAKVDLYGLDKRLQNVRIVVLCDVTNKLLGTSGAAAVFGPQKGASEEQIKTLDVFLGQLAMQIRQVTGRDMAAVDAGGVAGGAAGGLYAALDAQLKSGIAHFMELTGLEDALKKADMLITGEGSLDRQTLGGKGPYGLALKAKEMGKPVIAIAGKVPLDYDADMHDVFDVVLPICHEPMHLADALKVTRQNLIRTGVVIARFLSISGMD
ncbi:glycerate kinase [Olivibacter sitiensis]|uniref:glycerate kinase n=1 Tax=Olivibacter sitiensis TaxID=376470 RepID=UPI00040AD7F9|nr:glycerate kinase [Olivibacter sitiensis]